MLEIRWGRRSPKRPKRRRYVPAPVKAFRNVRNKIQRWLKRLIMALLFLGLLLTAIFLYQAYLDMQASITASRFTVGKAVLFLLICALVVAALYIPGWIRQRKKTQVYLQYKMKDVDKMDGVQFEEFLEANFSKLGYRVETTRTSGDFGADLILRKNGVKTVVQAKRYSSNVGVEALYQAEGGVNHYNADKAAVATNAHFTKAAQEHARKAGVILWDREALTEMFSGLED